MQSAIDPNIPELIRLNNALNLKVNSILGEENNLSTNNPITLDYQQIETSNFFETDEFGWIIKKIEFQQPASHFSVLLTNKSFNISSQPYINPLIDLTLCLTINEDLETDLVKYFKVFDKVKQIFISDNENIKDIRISLDMNEYDIDYMDQLFSQAQFPIQDKYSNQDIMLNFEYIFSTNKDSYNYLGKSIYTAIANG